MVPEWESDVTDHYDKGGNRGYSSIAAFFLTDILFFKSWPVGIHKEFLHIRLLI